MHKCESCKFQSKVRRNLQVHVPRKHVDHSQLQIYNCKLCNYKCKIKDDLRQHTRYKHTDLSEVYECDLCGRKFKTAYVKAHIKTMHHEVTIYKLQNGVEVNSKLNN